MNQTPTSIVGVIYLWLLLRYEKHDSYLYGSLFGYGLQRNKQHQRENDARRSRRRDWGRRAFVGFLTQSAKRLSEHTAKRLVIMLPWHQYVLGLIFIVAGVFHFQKPKLYKRVIPPYLPSPSTLVVVSGLTEMIAGFLLLNPETQVYGAWGIIIQLILFIPVHIYMLQNKKASMKLPKWVLILRLPLQFALIYWASLYI